MLENVKLNKILFLDIETVSAVNGYDQLSTKWKKLWDKKATYLINENEKPDDVYSRAAIYAEFGKVICISIGIIHQQDQELGFRIKSFSGKNEKKILSDFCNLLKQHFYSSDYLLCAHNGKEFDFPYLARRILVNKLKLPYLLDIAGRKPWEVQHLDTLQLWKFGDYKNYTSLDLLTQLFNIKSPKNEMDGSEVGRTYWEEDNLEKIVKYCQNDTLAVAQLLLAYQGMEQIKQKNVTVS